MLCGEGREGSLACEDVPSELTRAVRSHSVPWAAGSCTGPGEHRDTDPKKVDLETVQA